MNCSNCGSPQQEGAKFCHSCGQALHQEESSAAEAAPSSEASMNQVSSTQATVTPRVYPPEHGLSWSLFLTPIAGSIFWSKNWSRLGKSQHIWWTWVSGILVLFSSAMFGKTAGTLLYLAWPLILYILQRKLVPKHIKSVTNSVFSGIWALMVFVSIFYSGNSSSPSTASVSAPSSSDSTQTTAPTAPPAPTPSPAPQPAFTLSSDGGTYQGVEVSNVGMAISGVDTATQLGPDGFVQKADGKYVIVHVLVKNNQNDAITLTSSEFTIIDSQGRKFSDSTEGSTAYQMANDAEKDMLFNQLNPGVTTKGFIVFDVPSDLDISTSKLEVQGGFTGDKAQVPLAVQKQ